MGIFIRIQETNSPNQATEAASKYYDEAERECKIDDMKEKTEQRRIYFNRFIIAGIYWMAFAGVIILVNGFTRTICDKYFASDSVLIALIGSSTIAPLTLIGESLFDRSKD